MDQQGSPPQPSSPVRVYLVDDHELVRQGLRSVLSDCPGIEVVGESATAAEAARRIPAVHPDVAILDVRLPDGSGVDLCRQIRRRDPSIRALVVTGYDDDTAREAATRAGASGFVLKQIRARHLVADVLTVAAGGTVEDVRSPDPRGRPGPEDVALRSLTHRERRVLDLVAEGLTNGEVGCRLGIREKTVRNHVSNVLAKLGVTSRTQAAVLRVRHTDGPGWASA
ncbi:response regulator transcription factor [Phycicoccus sp. HDW14]|uniref:response regulator n=1 Tax=Phycicoccus sp. HDW14 TaxID=2714941 RepID=UPI00140D1D26|nr:response regulator transcription factor [Phycicoccus sp. HDW14]QIM20784.1 response regulator transcription factor [Phycicoccus sp. HDW14]